MDEFEKHIRDNASLFNDEAPNKNKIWGAIDRDLSSEKGKTKVIKLWQASWFKIAASVVLIICSSAIYFMSSSQTNDLFINKEVNDINNYYTAIIKTQVVKLKDNTKLSNLDKKEFLSYLEELEEEHKRLMKEMHPDIENNVILQAIISNYRKRIELIEDVLKKINTNTINNKQKSNGYIL